jgi:hypothetical protein
MRLSRSAITSGRTDGNKAPPFLQLEQARKCRVEREIAEVRRGLLRLEVIQRAVLLILTLVFALGIGVSDGLSVLGASEAISAAAAFVGAAGMIASFRSRWSEESDD